MPFDWLISVIPCGPKSLDRKWSQPTKQHIDERYKTQNILTAKEPNSNNQPNYQHLLIIQIDANRPDVFFYCVKLGMHCIRSNWPGTVQPGLYQVNIHALLQNLPVPETQCCFMTRSSTMKSSSFILIIIWSLPGHFIIADISSQVLYHDNICLPDRRDWSNS
jgi:hypothetical protein